MKTDCCVKSFLLNGPIVYIHWFWQALFFLLLEEENNKPGILIAYALLNYKWNLKGGFIEAIFRIIGYQTNLVRFLGPIYVEVMVPGVNCMYWPGPPEQTKGKEKSFHLPENNDKLLYKAE